MANKKFIYLSTFLSLIGFFVSAILLVYNTNFYIILGICYFLISLLFHKNNNTFFKYLFYTGFAIAFLLPFLIYLSSSASSYIFLLSPLTIFFISLRTYFYSKSVLDKDSYFYGKKIYLPNGYITVLTLSIFANIFTTINMPDNIYTNSSSIRDISVNGVSAVYEDNYSGNFASNDDILYINFNLHKNWNLEKLTYVSVEDLDISKQNYYSANYYGTNNSNNLTEHEQEILPNQKITAGKYDTFFYIYLYNNVTKQNYTHTFIVSRYDTIKVYCEKINFNSSININYAEYLTNTPVIRNYTVEFGFPFFTAESFYNRKSLADMLQFKLGNNVLSNTKYRIVDNVIYIPIRKSNTLQSISFNNTGINSYHEII